MPIGNKLGRFAQRSWVRLRDIKPALTVVDIGGTLSYAQAGGLPLPRNFRAGLITGNGDGAGAGDQDHDITIAVGQCRDSTDAVNILLETAITKQYDVDWAEGTGAGGLAVDDAMEADHTFHIFLIKDTGAITAFTDAGGGDITCAASSHLLTTNNRVTISGTRNYDGDYAVTAISAGTSFNVTATFVEELIDQSQTGTYESVDAGFDDDTTATNLLSDTGYTYYRRVGSFTTDNQATTSSDILAYDQVGNEFFYKKPRAEVLLVDHDGLASGSRTTISPDHIPSGFRVIAHCNTYFNDTGIDTSIYVTPLSVVDETPSTTVAPLATMGGQVAIQSHLPFSVITNTSGQFGMEPIGNVDTLKIATIGWYDFLGDND